jgi:hypothetical protein
MGVDFLDILHAWMCLFVGLLHAWMCLFVGLLHSWLCVCSWVWRARQTANQAAHSPNNPNQAPVGSAALPLWARRRPEERSEGSAKRAPSSAWR